MIKFMIPIIFVLAVYFQFEHEKEINENITNKNVSNQIEFDVDFLKNEMLETVYSFIDDIDVDSVDIYIPFK